MSEASEEASRSFESESVLELLREYYHVPVLLAILAFMFWVRVKNWRNFVVGGEVLFSGNDAWYHLRSVEYTVQNWPFTIPFDPWTHFPVGTSSGQFGTLFDQLVATAALVVGLGSPTDYQIRLALLFAPAVFGVLTAIPVYYIGKQVAGRAGALVGVLLLGISKGQFLTRSIAGFSDHHVAEVFFQALAIAAVVYALSVARRDRPIWELFTARDWEELRPTLTWSALAGLAVTLYLWTWPPGIFFVGVLGLFYAITLSYYQAAGESPEPVAITGVVIGLIAGLLTLLNANTLEFTATDLSLLQPTLAFGLAAGCAFMAGLARVWDDRDVERTSYPGVIAGILVVGTVLFWLLLPDQFDYMAGQIMRVFGYEATAASRTVSEAQPVPIDSAITFFFRSYGLALFTAIAGFGHMLYRIVLGDDRPDHLFVLVLSVFLLLAAMTQRRFDYYFVVAVAVLNAHFAAVVFRMVDLDAVGDSVDDIEAYQVLTVLTVFLLVAAPVLAAQNNAPAVADSRSSPGEVQFWQGSLEWMQDNTPQQGKYGGADGNLEYYGNFERTDDYDYDEGEYGTMAWWDYGHWITVLGERIPDANPFQQGATRAANFLLTTNESSANEYMVSEDGEETRYVMVDWKMADTTANLAYLFNRNVRPKFGAPYAFENEVGRSQGDDFDFVINSSASSAFTLHSQSYYESMRVRLYQFHGSAIDPKPVVVDYENVRTQGGGTAKAAPQGGNAIRSFDNVSAARDYVASDGSAQVGGLKGPYPSEQVSALQHYRLVHASERSAFESPGYQLGLQQYQRGAGVRSTALFYTPPQWVKTFEKVPGATVEGSGPANETVTAEVKMRMGSTNQTFTYRQQAETGPDGEFTMTLPYSTTGYEQWGTDEGYTNLSVRAEGPYTFIADRQVHESNLTVTSYQGEANVTEGQVLGENDSPVRVTLERQTEEAEGNRSETNGTDVGDGTNSTTGGDFGDGSGGDNDTSADDTNTSDGNATNGSSQSMVRPTHQYRSPRV